MSEAAIVRAITDYLLYRGALVLRVNSGAAIADTPSGRRRFLSFVRWSALGIDEQRAGCSDLLAILPGSGKLLAVECKTPARKSNVSQPQSAFLKEVADRGGIAVVASCIEDIQAVLE